MARSCAACKRRIRDDESAWRDMKKKYACNDCYQPARITEVRVQANG